MREYLDNGEKVEPSDEKYLKAMEEHSDRIIKKQQKVINRDTFETRECD